MMAGLMIARRLTGAMIVLLPFAAHASDSNKFNISTVEKAACTADAARLCSHTYPDQDQLLSCMRGNAGNLSLVCSTVFRAGLKKRGMTL